MPRVEIDFATFRSQLSMVNSAYQEADTFTQGHKGPPPGDYEVILADFKTFMDESRDKVQFIGFQPIWLIVESNDPDLKNTTFGGQRYRMIGKSLPFAKGFGATLAPNKKAPDTAGELADTLKWAKDNALSATINVSYDKQDGGGSYIRDRLTEVHGPSNVAPE